MFMKSIKDFDVVGKRVLVRCDFNVPVDEKGNILDDFRIKEILPTIKYLLGKNAKIILMSHLGEPGGKAVDILKLDKVQQSLEKLLDMDIIKSRDCIGKETEELSLSLKEGEVLLLENLRFYKEEMENDKNFTEDLSKMGEIYVNEAFGVDHRSHASLVGVPKFLPACAGFLLEKEIENLNKVLNSPQKPMVAIVGGTKVETKSKFIDKISKVADFVIISGLIKKEIVEKNVQFEFPEKIIGPIDSLGALDIDEKTIEIFREKILHAKTIVWNGPFGKFEEKEYEKGTLAIAKAIIESKAFSVIGGGETVEFITKHGLMEKFSHVSTGGGAMIAYLSGDQLPGLVPLEQN